MNEEIQKWFTEHGKVISAEPIEDKAAVVPGATIVKYTFEDGAVLTLRPAKYDNGTQVAPQEIVGRELPKPKEQTQSPSAARTAREEAEIAANAALPPDQDPRPETNAQRAERAERTVKEQGEAARREQADEERRAQQNRPDQIPTPANQPFIVERMPDGSLRTTKNPNYTGDKPEAGRSITVKGGDGKTYVVPIDPSGNPGQPRDLGIPAETPRGTPTQIINDPNTGERSEIIRNPDGTVKEVRPLPGSQTAGPTSRAPSLPQIVVGRSQDALRTAYDDIQAEVDSGRRTPAWGENRRKEVFEAAQLTVNEARVHEQSRQYNQTLDFNVSNTKLQHMSGALGDALKFAMQINGKLKPGSAAGANLFRAYFNLQMQFLRDSGIEAIRPGGGQSSVGAGMPGSGTQAERRPPPRVTDPGNPEKVAAQADQAEANIAAGLAQPGQSPLETATAPGAVPPTTPPPTSAPGVVPPPPGVAPVGAPAPVSTIPLRETVSTSTAGYPPPIPGQLRIRRLDQSPGGGTLGYETNVSQGDLDTMAPDERARWEVVPTPAPAPQAMTPPEMPKLAALEQFRMGDTPPMTQPPMQMPQVPPSPTDPTMTGELPNAVRLAQVRSTPPWMLDPSTLSDLVAQFGEDVVFDFPGRVRTMA